MICSNTWLKKRMARVRSEGFRVKEVRSSE